METMDRWKASLSARTPLLLFPQTWICGGLATLGVVGNSVTYSGTEFTTTAGFSSVQITSFTNNTTKRRADTHTTTNTPDCQWSDVR